ncbi:hypothetical protein ASF71_19025 [Deinococcus sp. Leaf326]|nr:hypothetical protein ASF71_19025 [Deinococcus sp. Leaf326]
MSLTTAIDTCDLPGLIAHLCGHEAVRGLGTKGGTICDPRPGMHEANPSFSVWRNGAGTWMWKKRGRNSGQGTAFTFLTSLGQSGAQARQALLEFTGTASTWDEGSGGAKHTVTFTPRDTLAEARQKAAEVRPMTQRQFGELRDRLEPLKAEDAAAQELARRGLWLADGLQAFKYEGDLVFLVRGPDGRAYNIKRRRTDAVKSKYQVMVPGLSTPAWCNPRYGQAKRVLLVEGELNAAAAWRVIRQSGLDLDVQGLAGTDTWPFLEGLDREVLIYADADRSGDGMRARMQDLAFASGAPRVQQLPALPAGQDFCDVLGEQGVAALERVLHAQHERPVEEETLTLWPAQFEVQQAARMSVLLGQPEDHRAWPLVRPR